MKIADKKYYELEFCVIYGEEQPIMTTRTKNEVMKIIENEIERNEQYKLHKLGYDNEQYNKQKNKLLQMQNILKNL